MARPLVVANWKNYPGSLEEAKDLLRGMSRKSQLYKKVSLHIAPPLTYLDIVSKNAKSFAQLASQDISSQYEGTYTGLVTPSILKSFGVKLSIIGHSEQRSLGETDEIISQKVKVALRAGITPLICIGEITRDQDGEHYAQLEGQLKFSLTDLKKADAEKLVIAYEPVWAIGKNAKGVLEPADLSQSVLFIKKVLTDMFGRRVAERIPILYGGSVDAANVSNLFRATGIKGFLVGRASLNAKNFEALTRALTNK